MGRPSAYYLGEAKPRNRVPSVTTVLRLWGDPGGLIWWAHKQGLDGIPLQQARQAACNAGTIGHRMIEEHLRGGMPRAVGSEDEGVLAAAEAGFRAYMEWKDMLNLRYEETEVPLVHDVHAYGGTLDFVGLAGVGGGGERRVLADWKLASGTWTSHVYQLAAYRELWNRHHPDRPVDMTFALRFGKPSEDGISLGGDFHVHSFTSDQMDTALEAFLSILQAYRIEKAVARWVR